MYPAYLKEREGVDVLEKPYGFATYKFRENDCYIVDIYVTPEKRRLGLASQLADEISEIARASGYRVLTGSVDVRDKRHGENAATLLAYGMRPYTQEGYITYFVKELT